MGKGRVVVRGFGRGDEGHEREGREKEDEVKKRKRLKEKADELLIEADEREREMNEKAEKQKAADEKRKAADEKRQKEKDTVESVKRYLVTVLKESGVYQKNLGYQIEAASSTIVLFRLVRDFILKNGMEPTVVETSREGDVRIKENPAFRIYAVFDSLLRKDLRALMMNLERIKSADGADGGDDELTELIENLRDD